LEAEVTAQRQGNKVEGVDCERDSQSGYISGAVRDVLVGSIHITLRTLNLLVREIGHSVDKQLAKVGKLGVTEGAPASREKVFLRGCVDAAERNNEAPEGAPRLRSEMGAVQVERPALRGARSDEVSKRENDEATESLVDGEVRRNSRAGNEGVGQRGRVRAHIGLEGMIEDAICTGGERTETVQSKRVQRGAEERLDHLAAVISKGSGEQGVEARLAESSSGGGNSCVVDSRGQGRGGTGRGGGELSGNSGGRDGDHCRP
jgi:hypothetical protein